MVALRHVWIMNQVKVSFVTYFISIRRFFIIFGADAHMNETRQQSKHLTFAQFAWNTH